VSRFFLGWSPETGVWSLEEAGQGGGSPVYRLQTQDGDGSLESGDWRLEFGGSEKSRERMSHLRTVWGGQIVELWEGQWTGSRRLW